MTTKDQNYVGEIYTKPETHREPFRPIDHFTEERRRWINRRQWIRAVRAIYNKHANPQDTPRVSITEDAEVEAEKEQLSQKSLLTGILIGMAVLLAWVVQLGMFPAVCG